MCIIYSTYTYSQIWEMDGSNFPPTTPEARLNSASATAPISFQINSTERMTLTTAGFVGIGNATSGTVPLVKLHIAGGPSPADGTFRTWMETGTYYQDDSDHMYVGLDKNTGVSNRKNAMIGWGDRLI